jgi:uncharacterized protein YjiS (DUF1127 family)
MTRFAPPSLVRRFASLAAAARHRHAARQLEAFDDRMLADIGVARSGIDFAVRHGRRVASVPHSNPAAFGAALAGPACAVLALIAVLSVSLVMHHFG